MKIKVYVIDFEAPKWVRKLIAYSTPVLAILGVATAVVAMPHVFAPSEVLTADNLNALNVLKTAGGATYSVGATQYCGVTTATFSGNMGGYAGAKQACENIPSCQQSRSAHMCTTEELVRSAQLGWAPSSNGYYWFAAGTWSFWSGTSGGDINDCEGFRSASSSVAGSIWFRDAAGANRPSSGPCNQAYPVLCCD